VICAVARGDHGNSIVFIGLWIACGVVTIIAAVLAYRSRMARYVGRVAVAALLIVGGALLHLINLVRPTLLGHLLHRVVWVRGLRGEHGDDLVAVAVRGGPRHPEPGADQRDLTLVAEPRQAQQRLEPAGQRPRALPSPA